MKKLFILPLLVLFILNQKAFSQRARMGINAGITVANMYSKADGEKENGDSKTGFTFGVFTDVPIGKHMSFQPGLHFTQKGTKEKFGYAKIKMNLNYVELPLNFMYNTDPAGSNFFIGGGPSIALGLYGKTTVKFDGDVETENVKFGNGDSDDMKRLDLGANFITGYSFKNGFRIAFNYNYGFSNLYPGETEEGKLRNSYFGLGVGFLFGHKK